MSFNVKPLNDIKRILFAETIQLLKNHHLIDKAYNRTLEKPNAELLEAIKKLDNPRNTQVEFLWKLVDVLDDSKKMGFFDEVLTDNNRARCFTGIALAILEQIARTYSLRDPSYNSRLYEGLQRAVGLIPEREDEEAENVMDLASKLSIMGYSYKFLAPYIYEDATLKFIRKETPFSDIKKLDLHEVFNTLLDLNHKTSLDAHAVAQKNTVHREEQRVQQAKERAKAEQPAKSYLVRMFGGSAPTQPIDDLPYMREDENSDSSASATLQ